MLKIPDDVIVSPAGEGRWVAQNIFARTALGLNTAALEAVRALERGYREISVGALLCWDIERYPHLECAMANPVWFVQNAVQWPTAEQVSPAQLAELCKKHFILVDDDAAYRARFQPKRHEVDHDRFGDFRDRLKQEFALHYPDRNNWWLDQKFTPDRRELKETAYKYVQEFSLKRFFLRKISRGQTVLDLGCGTGYYTNMMAQRGAHAIGIDPNESLINIGRANAHPGAEFHALHPGSPGGLAAVPDKCSDSVFMIDTYLMYFKAADFSADLAHLFADLRRVLKPGGSFFICDPHPVFLFHPWLGEADRPFTVVSEYREKQFGVVGTFEWYVKSASRFGFALFDFEEFDPDPAWEKTDPRGFHFSRQFPLWGMWEFRPVA